MSKIIIFIFFISILKTQAQDTLFLKNGKKIPVLARKTIFLDLKTVRLKKIIENSLVGENFKIDSIEFISLNDTGKIFSLNEFNNTKLKYFRFRTDSNTYVKISPSLISNFKEARKKLNTVEKKDILESLISFNLYAGYANFLSKYDREITLANQETVNIQNSGLFALDLSIYKPNRIGYGAKLQLINNQINFQNSESKHLYTNILISVGPNYVFNVRNIDLILKLNLGFAYNTSKTAYTEPNNFEYKQLLWKTEPSPLINPSLDIQYHPYQKIKFLASVGFNSFQNNFILKTINLQNDTQTIENKTLYQNLIDLKFGIAFNFKK